MTALAQRPRKLSIREFLRFYDSRPDEERWQLIDGVALLMTPPFPAHQRIASNLERLLNDAFEAGGTPLAAYQRIGTEVEAFPHYRPEPDVAVVDVDIPSDQRFLDRFYLVAEILSDSDDERIDLKRDYYRAHAPNRTILMLNQERIELEMDRRSVDGWSTEHMTGADALVDLSDFGISFRLGDLYKNTPLSVSK